MPGSSGITTCMVAVIWVVRSSQRFPEADITDVFLTHLHFDHCGGGIRWNNDRTKFEPAFPNATYWNNEKRWQWATQPNARERHPFEEEYTSDPRKADTFSAS